jgi:predicted unusual protein kinase regulating ubiquinone biosynthesis (AarF/ABC1/UbiB family)
MKEIKKIAAGRLKRNITMAKLAVKSSTQLLWGKEDDLKTRLGLLLKSEGDRLVNDLGLMKGALMKLGQMLSLYSESVLPDELKGMLKALEGKSYYLSWDEIQKNIPRAYFDELEIEAKPLAAASLGQVHRATIKKTQEKIVLKIQYTGVKKAIDNDIKMLKTFLSLARLIPKGQSLDFVFDEVKSMLHAETDYINEQAMLMAYQEKLVSDSRFVLPKVYPAYSSDSILALSYMEGVSLRDLENLNLSEADRNRLGAEFFELFLREVFEWGLVQTDPNPGNYLLVKDDEGFYRFGLLDFGASKKLNHDLQKMYHRLIFSVVQGQYENFIELLLEYQYLQNEADINVELFTEYLKVVSAPFLDQTIYDWGESEVAQEALKMAPRLVRELSLYRPPQDIVFIDRKIGGVFFILKMLKAKFNAWEVLQKFI